MKFQFRDYQQDGIDRALPIIREHGFVYLSMEVRTGKTHTALGIAESLKVNSAIVLTTKKTVDSGTIQADHKAQGNTFDLTVTNFESVHKFNPAGYDLLIIDEAHSLGAFPKKTKRADLIGAFKATVPFTILLSGTPTPESFCQIYHQLWGLPNSPFSHFRSFYRFADEHVEVKRIYVGTGQAVNDYSRGKPSILEAIEPFMVSATQVDAGFETPVTEHVHTVAIDPRIHRLIARLRRDKVIVSPAEQVILADTAVKELNKVHQMASGTVKFEDGTRYVLCTKKAEFIKENWKGQKIAVFYKFVGERDALLSVFGDEMTNDLTEFYETDKSLCIQIQSGRSGISLKQASALVFYNIDFSATSYWQARDRLTTKEREVNDIHWVFSDYGIEREIYETVLGKSSYTLDHYRKRT